MIPPIKQYRIKERLSQADLADKVGVSRQMVGFIETGKRRIAAEDVAQWEKETGIPRSKLRDDIFGKAAA